jgi:hypothetical protein
MWDDDDTADLKIDRWMGDRVMMTGDGSAACHA